MILLIINNLSWVIFIYLIYKDLRKGFSSPQLDIDIHLHENGKKIKGIVSSSLVSENKKVDNNEVEEDLSKFESLSNIPFSDVVASVEKEIKDKKKK